MRDYQVNSAISINSVYRACIRFYVIGPKTPDEMVTSSLPAFFPRLRSSGEKEREEVLLRILAGYRQFHAISGIAFVPKRIPSMTARLLLSREIGKPNHGWQQGLLQSGHFVSYSALATLWHFPQNNKTKTLKNGEEPKGHSLPLLPAAIDQIISPVPIGYLHHGGNQLPFRFPVSFFDYHTLIAGEPTEGKSAFLKHLAHSAMLQGGLVLIDPYGDLSEDILKIVPLDRVEDVVLVDLSDSMASIGFNPLDVTLGHGQDQTISDLLRMLVHIWVASWGTKMETIFEMSLRTLFEANKTLVDRDPQGGLKQQYTLLDVAPLLTNAKFCHMVLQLVQDDSLHRWWREHYKLLSLAQRQEIINPLIAKVAKLEGSSARRIVGQSASTLNLAQMIAERKIILLKLAKSLVGDEIATLIGSAILGLILLTLEEQNLKITSQHDQAHLPIIVDEFAMFLGTNNGTLAELHKHGATFFLSCQSLEYIQELNPFLLSTVQANVRQLVAFHMSGQDAEVFHQELGIERDDLIHLDRQSCYIARQLADQRLSTFSLKVVPPPQADATLAERIRTRCRIRYAYPVDEVDAMLGTVTVRTIRQAPLPRERKNKSGGEAFRTSSNQVGPSNGSQLISNLSSKTNPLNERRRFMINDTQPLPIQEERDTQKLGISSHGESKSYVERSSASREKRRGNPLEESTDEAKTTEKLKLMDFRTPRPGEKNQKKQV